MRYIYTGEQSEISNITTAYNKSRHIGASDKAAYVMLLCYLSAITCWR